MKSQKLAHEERERVAEGGERERRREGGREEGRSEPFDVDHGTASEAGGKNRTKLIFRVFLKRRRTERHGVRRRVGGVERGRGRDRQKMEFWHRKRKSWERETHGCW